MNYILLPIALTFASPVLAHHPVHVSTNAYRTHVIDPPSNIREYANGPIICSANKRSEIWLGWERNGWFPTRYCNGQLGWIHHTQVSL